MSQGPDCPKRGVFPVVPMLALEKVTVSAPAGAACVTTKNPVLAAPATTNAAICRMDSEPSLNIKEPSRALTPYVRWGSPTKSR